jgi:serine/threonine protein kinase
LPKGETEYCNICGKMYPAQQSSTEPPDARIGTIIDKYRIVRLLGRGGMGSVYEAEHTILGRRFAMKFMLPEYAADRAKLLRFENEARAAGSLEHPNIAAVTDYGRAQDDSPYLVIEYLAGQDCAKLLAELGPLPVRRAADIVFQACLGLAVAHKAGIVHRDIKPENLFITELGDDIDLVKILDFGIAKLRLSDSTDATATGARMGTIWYTSPEQFRDAANVDARVDIWALGVVLYELLTGRRPFCGVDQTQIMYEIVYGVPEQLDQLCPDVPAELVATVARALEKDVGTRLQSASALAEALAPFTGRAALQPAHRATASVAVPPVAAVTRPATTSHDSVSALSRILAARARASSRWTWAAIGTGLLLAAAAATVVALRASDHPEPSAVSGPAIPPTRQSLASVGLPATSASAQVITTAESVRTVSELADTTSNSTARPNRAKTKPSIAAKNSVSIDTSNPF